MQLLKLYYVSFKHLSERFSHEPLHIYESFLIILFLFGLFVNWLYLI